jgi:hypothetical protein
VNPYFLKALEMIDTYSNIFTICDLYYCNGSVIVETLYGDVTSFYYWDGNNYCKAKMIPSNSVMLPRDFKSQCSILNS